MVSTAVKMMEESTDPPGDGQGAEAGIRIILADTQAIFRAGIRKILALEDDIRVVGQAESFVQAIAAAGKFSADVILFESALASDPADAVTELQRQAPKCRTIVVTSESNQEQTLECFRRGAYGVISREIEPEQLVECVRKVAQGEPWLDQQGVNWVLEAYRSQGTRGGGGRPKVQLTPKESIIVSCVTQGMKNKEIANRVGTTEQVVKNYLRKVYDKLGVADRLELALYCLHHRVLESGATPATQPAPPANGAAQPSAAAAMAATPSKIS